MIPEEDFARQRDFYYSCIYIYIYAKVHAVTGIFSGQGLFINLIEMTDRLLTLLSPLQIQLRV